MGGYKKGWMSINTGAEMLCMMLNKTGTALQHELNIVLRKYPQSVTHVCSEIKICE